MHEVSFELTSLIPSTRHDGWTGEVMAKFLETLAETGMVIDACNAAGRSRETGYALRHGREVGDWTQQGYCRSLDEDELAALVTAGVAEPSVSIDEDEAKRDAFFSGLIAQMGTCPQPAGA